MPRIAVDLTPLLPGGENGAAKLLVLELLSQFKELVHPYNFLLLTAHWNHQELVVFDGPRFQRLCVMPVMNPTSEPAYSSNFNYLTQLIHHLRQALPERIVARLLPPARWLKQQWLQRIKPFNDLKVSKGLLADQEVDLLFCPFTAPIYAEPGIPVVSIFYDLQHHTYPQFFDPKELECRDDTLNRLRQRVESIVCISEFSRQTLLEDLKIAPERTFTVPVCIHSRLCETTPALSISEKSSLKDQPYLFYPANYWPHKNHKMLLTAYNILLKRNPGLELDLVLTGALDQSEKELHAAVDAIGIGKRVHFLGYLTDEELAAVFRGCQFLIFPSLYEGFGVPILEAFAFGKPVLCSRVCSLPEVSGKAALCFDPRKPLDIVRTIEQVITNPKQATELVEHGYEQVSKFSREKMALCYLDIFNKTLQKKSHLGENPGGVSLKNQIINSSTPSGD